MYNLHLSAEERRHYIRTLRADADDATQPDTDISDEPADGDPKQGDTTSPVEADPGANPMRVVTANIKHTMTRAQIEVDVKKVAGCGSVIFWQEVHAGAYRNAILQYLPDRFWQHIGLEHEAPISVKRSMWDVRHPVTYKLHDAWTNGDPARYLTTALLKAAGSNVQFLAANTHLVANAWGNTKRPNTAWKQRMWNLSYDKFQALVLDARAKGLPVVGGGDWNKHDVPKFHSAQVWLRTAHIDYLFGLPAAGGSTFTVDSSMSVALNSDHNALVAQLTWTAGTNPVLDTYYWPGN